MCWIGPGLVHVVATTRVTALKLPGLPFALEPAGSPPPGCRVRHGVLTLTGAAGTDLFVDPAGANPGQVPTPAG